MFTILESVWEYTMAELGLDGTQQPTAPQPPATVVVSSQRGGPITMQREGRSDGKLMDDYRLEVFNRDMLVIAYSEMRIQAA